VRPWVHSPVLKKEKWLKEIKGNLNKRKDVLCSCIRKLNIVKTAVLS
jgi:hypothetical protein